jgi:excinuclease ABC subunit C
MILKNIVNDTFPETFGCYLMYCETDVIYIGKSVNLKSRVLSYFDERDLKSKKIIEQITDIKYIVCDNERDSLILEEKLIKQYKPKFNIKLKYSNKYPYVEFVDSNGFFYLRTTYTPRSNVYFGPFVNSKSIYELVDLLNKLFKLRTCSNTEFKNRKEPCIVYQMNYCSAPCVQLIKQEEYLKSKKELLDLFSGKSKQFKKKIQQKMNALSSQEKFEEAIIYRNVMVSIGKIFINEMNKEIKLTQKEQNCYLVHFFESFIAVADLEYGNIINQTVIKYSCNNVFEIQNAVNQINIKNKQVYIQSLNLVLDNAKKASTKFDILFKNLIKKAEFEINYLTSKEKEFNDAMADLKNWMQLNPSLNIQRIECFDVSVWQGSSPAGSRIVMENGFLIKNEFKYYSLSERPEGNNDLAMMQELIEKRINSKTDKVLPDVILIDGGRLQLSAVNHVLERYKMVDKIILIGIAKEKNDKDERLFCLKYTNPYILTRTKLLKPCVSLRNNAHDFSRKLHHNHELKKLIKKK